MKKIFALAFTTALFISCDKGDNTENTKDVEYYTHLRNTSWINIDNDGFVDKKTGISYDDTVFAIPDEEFNKDMEGVQIHGEQVTLDHFNGASVSTNNILRMLLPLMEYHAANNI